MPGGQSRGGLYSWEGHRDEQRLKGGKVKDLNPALPKEIQWVEPSLDRASLPHPRADVKVGADIVPPSPLQLVSASGRYWAQPGLSATIPGTFWARHPTSQMPGYDLSYVRRVKP